MLFVQFVAKDGVVKGLPKTRRLFGGLNQDCTVILAMFQIWALDSSLGDPLWGLLVEVVG